MDEEELPLHLRKTEKITFEELTTGADFRRAVLSTPPLPGAEGDGRLKEDQVG